MLLKQNQLNNLWLDLGHFWSGVVISDLADGEVEYTLMLFGRIEKTLA